MDDVFLSCATHAVISIFPAVERLDNKLGFCRSTECKVIYNKKKVGRNANELHDATTCLKDVLLSYLCIAFMFNGGQLPALTIHPIDTRVCMVHL